MNAAMSVFVALKGRWERGDDGQHCEKSLIRKGKERGKNVRQLTKHNVVSWTFNLTATPYHPFTF